MPKPDAPEHGDLCPLHAVHQRLEDLHRQWHQAAEAYFDPDGFRLAIQTAIQISRTVTFILQSNKKHIPDFDRWYGDPRAELKEPGTQLHKLAQIPLMRWMVDARNKIEKQGDLEAHSFVRAEIVASYLEEGPGIEVSAELSQAPLELLKSIPESALGAHLKKDGILRIQRRWVENSLPDFELLDAVARAYGHLSEVLDDAHKKIGLPISDPVDLHTGETYDSASMKGRLPCMIGHSDTRTMNIWIADGRAKSIKSISVPIEKNLGPKLEERYGIKLTAMFGSEKSAIGVQDALFRTAQKVFAADGHHDTMLFLLRGDQVIDLAELAPMEHGDKYLLMRNSAHQVERKGADGVLLMGEVWAAQFDPKNPYRRAVDSPNKVELLTSTLVMKVGEPRYLSMRINREGESASLSDKAEKRGGAHFMFAPFYEVWGREIPKDWIMGIADAMGVNPGNNH